MVRDTTCRSVLLTVSLLLVCAALSHSFRNGEKVPPGKVVDRAHKGNMPLCKPQRVVTVPVYIGQPALQLFFNSN